MTNQILNYAPILDEFFGRLRPAPARVLMLDFDGTLAPFNVDPAQAYPYPGVCSALEALMAQQRTRLVLVSGRWIKDLAPLLGLSMLPELWGSHGWERLGPDGDYTAAQLNDDSLRALLEADECVAEIERLGGRCERKPGSIAIHWRGLAAEQIADVQTKALEHWENLTHRSRLVWHEFDGGIELRAPGRDKGYVVRAVLSEEGQSTVAAYLGDDQTDEDAFRVLKGRGLGVLVRPQFRRTAADVWIRPPHDLLEFFGRWAESCAGER